MHAGVLSRGSAAPHREHLYQQGDVLNALCPCTGASGARALRHVGAVARVGGGSQAAIAPSVRLLFRRRRMRPRPTSAAPSTQTEAGSGTSAILGLELKVPPTLG